MLQKMNRKEHLAIFYVVVIASGVLDGRKSSSRRLRSLLSESKAAALSS